MKVINHGFRNEKTETSFGTFGHAIVETKDEEKMKAEKILTEKDLEKAPLLDQILYDETGMLVENHPSIAEAMEKYHQAKLKLLGNKRIHAKEIEK